MMISQHVRSNPDTRMFIIPAGDGYSCMGFDNVFAHAQQLSELLHRPDLAPKTEEVGQRSQYKLYLQLADFAGLSNLGTYFDPGTPKAVREILETYRTRGAARLRLFFGDQDTGRDWLEEHGVVGRIGRSTGPLKAPLLIESLTSRYGGAILSGCIVRILDATARYELYRHPRYHQAQLTVVPCDHGAFKAEVLVDGEVHVRFRSQTRAVNWLAFMRGERMRP